MTGNDWSKPSFTVPGPSRVEHDCQEHLEIDSLWLRKDGRCWWCGEQVVKPEEPDANPPRG